MGVRFKLLDSSRVKVGGEFWGAYQRLVKEQVIPYQWGVLNDTLPQVEPSYTVRNFRIASGELEGEFHGMVFQDSDLYKWLEAVGNVLQIQRDEELERQAKTVIGYIAAAQEPDGYLNTYYQIKEPHARWTNVLECHELYCAGHFFEAAASYYTATGDEQILQAACRLADHIGGVFGPEEGKLHGYPGHQEIEIGLLRLYDVTGTEAYRELASYFIDARGTNRFFEEEHERRGGYSHWTGKKEERPIDFHNHFPYAEYSQFHQPVREQRKATGHAVRAVYMYSAMAELAALNEDEALRKACASLWSNITEKQMYITGGIGSTPSGEAFSLDYDLPNDTVYAETCASIGLIFFAQKMLLNHADRRYGDVMEQALYNTVLAGMAKDGKSFFYVNPLEATPDTVAASPERYHVKPERPQWYACACCPPNLARLISGLARYVYTVAGNTIYTHLYLEHEAEIPVEGGVLSLRQSTGYPWNGGVSVGIRSETGLEAELAFRIPGWCQNFTAAVNGAAVDVPVGEDGFVRLKRVWKQDSIQINLEMKPLLYRANPRVHYNGGKTALMRGPVAYCLEEADNGKYLSQLSILPDGMREQKEPDGTVSILLQGLRACSPEDGPLYSPSRVDLEPAAIKAVPYYTWNNRGPGEMLVWMRTVGK